MGSLVQGLVVVFSLLLAPVLIPIQLLLGIVSLFFVGDYTPNGIEQV